MATAVPALSTVRLCPQQLRRRLGCLLRDALARRADVELRAALRPSVPNQLRAVEESGKLWLLQGPLLLRPTQAFV
eukprot:11213278-Lingulodinium_polyedra.AAC.1